jgi:structure-specific recognition protein 1
VVIKGTDIKRVKFVHVAKFHQLWVKQKGGAVVQFDGFRGPDYEGLNKIVSGVYGLEFPKEELSTSGWHWGEVAMNKNAIQFMIGDKKAFELPLASVAHATQIKDDVQLIFPPQADGTGVTPSLVELRFAFPENGNLRGEKREGSERADPITDARFFQELVLQETAAAGGGESKLVEIPKLKLALPRGRFDLELFPRHAKLVGSNPYRIPYESVARMYHLPAPKGDNNVMFILSMEPPIRRGQTVYQHVIMELPTDEHMSLNLSLTPEQLNQYQGQLNSEMKGKPSSLVARLFKVLTGKKVTIPGGSFKSSAGQSLVPCSVGASTGHLYMLERSMFFIDKPAINIMYEHIEQVEFQRHSQITSNRNFDLEVKVKPNRPVNLGGRPKTTVTFSHIAREERTAFVNMFRQKDIPLKGLLDDNDEQLVKQIGGESDDDDEDRGEGGERRAKRPAVAAPGQPGEEDSEHDSSFGSQKSSESDDLEYASKASSDSDSGGEGGDGAAKASAPKKPKTAEPPAAEKEEEDDE